MIEEKKLSKYIQEEIVKIQQSPYYFYTTYLIINGKKAETIHSEEEFNRIFKWLKNKKK